LIPAL
jgi:hypothetical protein